jgi:membrane protein implicated in regulation of membrane protease activity
MILSAAFVIIGNLLLRSVLGGLLQYFLCSKNLKLGLILPILSLALSVVYELFIVFSVIVNDGVVVAGLGAAVAFVLLNVPALVFYLIYRKMKKKAQSSDINRMKINDLE